MIRIFRHYMPKALVLLGLAEAFILLTAIYLGALWRAAHGGYDLTRPIFPKAVIFLAIMLVVMTALGLYQREPKEGQWGYFPRLWVSFFIGLAVMSLVFYLVPSLFLGRGIFGAAFIVGLAGVSAARLLYIKLADHDATKRRVLVLGTGSRALKVDELERAARGRAPFQVVGYLPYGADDVTAHARVLPDRATLGEVVRKYRVEEVVVAIRDRRGKLPMQDLLACRLAGVPVVDLPAFFERETGRIQLETLNTSWLVFSDGFQQTLFQQVTKRVFDVVVSTLLLTLAGPLMLLVAYLIGREDGGPVFYKQERVGQNGKAFHLIKFRSMRVDAEQDGVPQWAQKNDGRVTRIGRIIRKLRIDELPQVFNVLRGDMSFVGPRPERPYFVDQLARQIGYYNVRHTVKPGITGWAQIRYPYGASIEDAIQKLQYDLYYVKNNTLFLDIIILFQTAQVLLWNDGAR